MKTIMKKVMMLVLSIILAIGMIIPTGIINEKSVKAANGSLYIHGTQLSIGESYSGATGTASFAMVNGKPTLTLNNFVSPSGDEIRTAIECSYLSELVIVLKGESTLKLKGYDISAIISNNTHITIKGNGKLTINANETEMSANYGIIIYSEGLTIEGGTLDINSAGKRVSVGISAEDDVFINGGSLLATSTKGEEYNAAIDTTGNVVIKGEDTRVEASSISGAVVGTVKNSIPGRGWNNITGEGDSAKIPINEDGSSLVQYRKVIFEPFPPAELFVKITGNTDTVTYTGSEQFVSGYSVEYKVEDGSWTTTAPEGVSVKLKEGYQALAKGVNAKKYPMGLSSSIFDIDAEGYDLRTVNVTDGLLTINKADLSIKANNQTYIYNGEKQGEGDTTYDDPAVIADKVSVQGLKGNDVITSIVLDGQGQTIGHYPLVPSNARIGNVTDNYKINYINGEIIITEKVLRINVNGSSATKTYNGKEQNYNGKVIATCTDKGFDPSKFRYTGSTAVKGTSIGEYSTALAKESCVYDDAGCEVEWIIGNPIRLKIDPAEKEVKPKLIIKMTSKKSNMLVLKWNKISGAEGYDIFFKNCGKKKAKKIKTIKGNKTFKWTKKGLKKRKTYKAIVKAFVIKNGKKKYIKTSPMVHSYTSGGTKKYTNPKSVKLNKTKVTLKIGEKFKIKGKVLKLKKHKKLMPTTHTHKLRFLSSDKKIATVSGGGRITAKAKGKCKVYAVAINGVSKTVSVTVK